ncbi:uncharacterized protein LOC128989437 isoform X2 [Macrosteles quadrilineatus]|uniref:uncharacterized protein LOC128989437 isoform X2 n=1 Tax=Macrosteles quadrilineatus TaxID=74068 RepID=UPI0023E278FE|nr:uncharacterized protein LOC128989437 isoform X2 [Macrosteles quadrilineatus]
MFSEYSSSKHLQFEAYRNQADDPNGSLYMLCGVLIAMLLVGVIIVLLAVTISKLRKREDNLHTTVTTNHNNNVIHHQQQTQQVPQQQQQPQCQEVVVSCPRDSQESLPPPFLWTNSRCSTTASSQYTLYNNDEVDKNGLLYISGYSVLTNFVLLQDNLVHSVACEEPRECKGLRKNLSGKWRRLVKKKPPQEVYTLPAELRDQLKTIYVY